MPHTNVTKKERVQIRTDGYTKRKLQLAADYTNKTVSEFILSNSIAAADKILAERKTIELSELDWDAFYEALLAPPEPNDKFRTAFKRYYKSKE